MMDFERVRDLLSAVAMAEAQRRRLTLNELAKELGARQIDVEGQLDTLQEQWGLLLLAPKENTPPILLDAGRQYLAKSGQVDGAVLTFLPRASDDLHTRSALLEAGTILVDEFRAAVLAGDAIAYARERVPRPLHQRSTTVEQLISLPPPSLSWRACRQANRRDA